MNCVNSPGIIIGLGPGPGPISGMGCIGPGPMGPGIGGPAGPGPGAGAAPGAGPPPEIDRKKFKTSFLGLFLRSQSSIFQSCQD